MIKQITIKDYAIFKDLNLKIKKGLTVITGETGSGKSIFVSAIQAALGGNGKKTDVRSSAERAVIEVVTEQGGTELICRKIIGKSGRSRSFLNDAPVPLSDYNEQVKLIADFHGQHEQQFIMQQAAHVDFLDTYAQLSDRVTELEQTYADLIAAKQKNRLLRGQQTQVVDQKKLLSFQLQEIELIQPKENEDDELSREFKQLKHAEKLITTARELNDRLTENEQSQYNQLVESATELEKLTRIDQRLENHSQSLTEALKSVLDASEGLRRYADVVDYDDKKLNRVEERLQKIEGLKRKYGGSIAAVLEYKQAISAELNSLSTLNDEISTLDNEIVALRERYKKTAIFLHDERKKNIPELCQKIVNELVSLDIPRAVFKVRVAAVLDETSDIEIDGKPIKYTTKGYDKIEFYLSANPGEEVKPLTAVASGGEVSRIMLAIKTIFQKVDPVDTLFFDEIDSGVSGVAAEKVGVTLQALAKEKQLICVTHLPQIAAMADHHLMISKMQQDQRTVAQAFYLTPEGQVQAIAQLFSGVDVVADAVDSAQSMLAGARG